MVCQLLVEDPDLAEAIPADLRVRAAEECIAPVARLAAGAGPANSPTFRATAIGLLVLEGLLIRRVGVDGRFGAELLGVGDLLRPWQGEDAEPTLPHTAGWRVLQTCRVATLDRPRRGETRALPRTDRQAGRPCARTVAKPCRANGDRSPTPHPRTAAHAALAPRRSLGPSRDQTESPSRCRCRTRARGPRRGAPSHGHRRARRARKARARPTRRHRPRADRRAARRASGTPLTRCPTRGGIIGDPTRRRLSSSLSRTWSREDPTSRAGRSLMRVPRGVGRRSDGLV